MDKLYIIIPAYNEEANIELVAREWHEVVAGIGQDSRLVIINDGSKDQTYEKLCALQAELPQLLPVTKENGGHGATVLYGYFYALEHGADYIFQIQMGRHLRLSFKDSGNSAMKKRFS